ncbi:LysR family transcriptional regulator substrate-binding protein [Pseudomonas syringae]|uniref:LysR family transcriptional regulator substrate-binding protein n=1 Tax=Pseudomonas syringae TaxID=317 RepID=UPI0032D99DB4
MQSSWDSVVLGTDEMVLCMNEHNPLAQKPFLEARHLQDEPMVVFDQTFLQRHYSTLSAMRGAQITGLHCKATSCHSSLRPLPMVWGFPPYCALLRSASRAFWACLSPPPQTMSFSLRWRAGEYLSFANKRFVDFVQTTDIFKKESARGQRAE